MSMMPPPQEKNNAQCQCSVGASLSPTQLAECGSSDLLVQDVSILGAECRLPGLAGDTITNAFQISNNLCLHLSWLS